MATYNVIINQLNGNQVHSPNYTLNELLRVIDALCNFCGHDSFRSIEIYRNGKFFKAII